MALGARRSGLFGTTMESVLAAGLSGVAVGQLGALWTSSLLGGFLLGIGPSDPATYGAVAAASMVVCLLVSCAAARRIFRVSPVDVLRAE